MPSESRTFIQLTDILGVEFECPKCQAKILYPIKKHYEPLPENCPSCGQVWFDENPNLPANEPKIVELVQKTFTSLHNIAETPAIQARVRLNINDPLAARADTQSEDDKKGSPAKKPSSEQAKAS